MKRSMSLVNAGRYRKVVWFFAAIFWHIIWWDLILRKVPLLNHYVRRSATQRWRLIARRFRSLAIEMGGVLIKLGQFLSIRVDVLPLEITTELANLQDEVPAEPIEKVIALVEADFNRPLNQIFTQFSSQPIAAASLAQTHTATLPNGQEVVVKVQRPGIDVLVATDLKAIGVAIRWLKFYPLVSKRVNLDWLAAEFTTVTNRELDFVAEGKNAEKFTADFARDPGIYIPKIYWDYTTPHALTMENVAYLRIGDLQAIDQAGISRPEVAKKLYNTYMQQIFVTYFVHADPHPGNLFVRALPRDPNSRPETPTPFQIIFVDFGMVVYIPERLRSALRNYAIGIGTRDVARIIQSYLQADVLLPGADLKRLEEAHQAVFDRFWGAGMTQMRDLAMSEAPHLIEEYRDLIYEAPFQFQVDMLFAARAVGLLSGMATNLDPHFDPWTETIPFAERLARDELKRNWQSWAQELVNLTRVAVQILPRADKVLTQLERGTLSYEVSLSPAARKTVNQLDDSVQRLMWTVVCMGGVFSGVTLRIAEGANPTNTTIFIVTAVLFIWKVLGGKK